MLYCIFYREMQLQLFRLKFFCKVCSLCKQHKSLIHFLKWNRPHLGVVMVLKYEHFLTAKVTDMHLTLWTHWERKLHPKTRKSCRQIPSPCLVYWVLVLRVHCVTDTFKPKEKNTTCIYSQSMITIWHTVNVRFLLAAVRSCSFVLPHFTNIWGKNSPDLRHLFIFHMFL